MGRAYDAVIRVNSQSGKGGIAYLLGAEYGFELPRRLQIEFARVVQEVTDSTSKEISAEEIHALFNRTYVEATSPYRFVGHRIDKHGATAALEVDLEVDGVARSFKGTGNGPIDAMVSALNQDIRVMDYHEHALDQGANAAAVAYVEIRRGQGPALLRRGHRYRHRRRLAARGGQRREPRAGGRAGRVCSCSRTIFGCLIRGQATAR